MLHLHFRTVDSKSLHQIGKVEGVSAWLLYTGRALRVDLVQEGELPSFQFALWMIESGNQCVFAVSIYRPPYTTTSQITDAQFTTDFAELIPYITIQYKNTRIPGDFNFHINDSMDANASIFQDVMVASGLSQWVDFPTHRLGNTLDLVFYQM